jgi:hypothetical protein
MDGKHQELAETVVLVVETKQRVALLFTNARLVVADLGELGAWYELAMLAGGIGGLVAGLPMERRLSSKLDELLQLPVERVLQLSRKSYFLPYADIESITFGKRMFDKVVKIAAGGRRRDFIVKRPDGIPNYAGVLASAIGTAKVLRETGV